jgi:hypothetical protein
MDINKIAPLPWRIEADPSMCELYVMDRRGKTVFHISDDDDIYNNAEKRFCNGDETRAVLKFIVSCVNKEKK